MLFKRKFRVFLSHKVKAKGQAATEIASRLENLAPDKLCVFASPEIQGARRWRAAVHKELQSADLFVLLYTDRSKDMDWCLFESGVFTGQRKRPKLMCLHPERLPVPKPLQSWENVTADEAGVTKLLRAVFADRRFPVRKDLFDEKNRERLEELTRTIIELTGPGPAERLLAARLSLTMPASTLKTLWQGGIPADAVIKADATAAAGIGLSPDQPIRWGDLVKIVECDEAMPLLTVHLAQVMAGALRPKQVRWAPPPVRFKSDGPAWILTLTRVLGQDVVLEELTEASTPERGKLRFDFVLSKPWASYRAPAGDPLNTVYHLVSVAWHCRWRVTEGHLNKLRQLRRQTDLEPQRAVAYLAKVSRDLQTVLLDCVNRGLKYPEATVAAFVREGDRKTVEGIVRKDTGRWEVAWQRLLRAVAEGDLDPAIQALEELHDISGEIFVLAARRLAELAAEQKTEPGLADWSPVAEPELVAAAPR